MTAQNRATLKTYFMTGDKPTQSQFGDTIDSFLSLIDTTSQSITSNVSAQGSWEFKSNITVSGTSTFNGPTSLNGSITATSLSVTGSGASTLSGNLSVVGTTTLASATCTTPAAGDVTNKISTMASFAQGTNGTCEVLIATTAAANVASISFSNIPAGFDQYELRVTNLLPVTNNTNFLLRIGNPIPITTVYDYSGLSALSTPAVSAFGVGGGSGTALPLTFNGVSNSSAGANGKFIVTSLAVNSLPAYTGTTNYNNSTLFCNDTMGGIYAGGLVTATVIQILCSSGNISSGKLSLYGIRNS